MVVCIVRHAAFAGTIIVFCEFFYDDYEGACLYTLVTTFNSAACICAPFSTLHGSRNAG